MKIVAISDTHGRLPEIPECDVLCIAGDFCAEFMRMYDPGIMRMRQMDWLRTVFVKWEQTVPTKRILITPGNHDWITELPEECASELLIDREFVVDGYRFYGTPWVSPIWNWNYMLKRGERKERFAQIPAGLDVLIAHSPVEWVLDRNWDGEHCGCPELRQVVLNQQPKHCIFGHIHEGVRDGKMEMLGKTAMHNVAMQANDWTPTIFSLPIKTLDL